MDKNLKNKAYNFIGTEKLDFKDGNIRDMYRKFAQPISPTIKRVCLWIEYYEAVLK